MQAATGEEVDLVARPIWPDERLPSRVERWLAEDAPDLVFFSVPGYWFNYESVPLKLKRHGGPVGRWLARIGFAAADKPHIAYNGLFRAGRTIALRTIGGEAQIEPRPLMEVIETCLRTIVRNEHTGLAMDGPNPTGLWTRTDHHRQWRDSRLAYMTRSVAQLCDELHVPVVELPPPGYLDSVPLEADGTHRTGEAFERMIAACTVALTDAWQQVAPHDARVRVKAAATS